MKRRILCFVLTMAMVLSMLVIVPAATVAADSDTIEVGTKAELAAIATANNDGSVDYSGKTIVLTADIDLSGSNWTSIGTSSYPFKGSFNGQGHTISGMTRSGGAIGQNVGLFGVVSSPDGGSTTIQNFKLGGSIVSSNGGDNAGTVVSAVKPSATGTTQVSISGIWSTVNFDASTAKMTGVGGILGTIAWCTSDYEITVNIDSCRYSGTLDSPSAGSNDYGGIMGYPKEAASPRTVNITNCIFDGVISLYGSAPDDNGGIVGYFKGNGGNSRQTNIHIENCIVAGQFKHQKTSSQTVTGYVVSEYSGSNTDYAVTNVYYCDDSDRHTGGAMGGWYGYMKGGSTDPSGITKTNVTAKTMTELKAMTSGFADDSKWHFYNNGSDLPIPAMIYDNIIANQVPSIFDDLSQPSFTITTADELMQFASIVNAGTSQFQDKTVYLGADIDLTGYSWQSIGKTRGNGSVTFRGTFDGQNHTISNMTSTVTNADGEGGLFGYVVYSATIKNFKLTGTITANATSAGDRGYYGSVIGCVFQESATVTLQNIWSSVNIKANNPSAGRHYAIGGLVGWIRNANGTMTLDIDSCVYDGDMDISGQCVNVGGILGGTNANAAGRTLTINIFNTVCGASIHLNNIWSEDVSALIGYIKGNSSTGAVNVNLTNVISTGTFYFYTGDNRAWNPTSKCVGGILSSKITGSVPVVNVTNLYYKNFQVPTGDGEATTTWSNTALYFNEPTCTIVVPAEDPENVVAVKPTDGEKDQAGLLALDVTTDLNPAKWTKLPDDENGKYYPCPTEIYTRFGMPDSLIIENNEISIGTDEAMAAFAAGVNGGKTYAGKTIKLTADVNLTTTIGETSSKPFSGNFDGQGHTVTITQSLTNPDGIGGLFSFVRVPANSTLTIQNVHLAGTITLTNSTTGMGYVGALISTVDAGESGSSGTLNVTNVWSTTRINAGLANTWYAISGFIGFVRHAAGLKPLTINMDSCLWDGVLNFSPATEYCGGFLGYTGNGTNSGRPLNLNITNSVVAGTMMLNAASSDDTGLLTGYLKGNGTNSSSSAVTANFHDLIITGTITSSTNLDTSKWNSSLYEVSGTTVVDMNNFYYIPRTVRNKTLTVYEESSANPATTKPTGTATAKNATEMYALTGDNFSDASKWTQQTGYYLCPTGIYSTFNNTVPSSLKVSIYDVSDEISIGTTAEFLEFRDEVNAGKSMAGKTITLTADIDLADEEWVSIGVPGSTKSAGCKSFCGTFDGDGHTISNMTTFLEPTSGFVDMQGGLFSSLGDGAVVKNFYLTGTYYIHNISTTAGTTDYFGSVANAVKGTVLIQNVHSSVNITTKVDKNSNNGWPGAIERVGGLVGFIYHDCSANLTIDSCTYSGTINTANQAIDFAGIMAHTGNNTNSSTKVVTISNCAFTGKMTVNENSPYAMQGIAGIISHVAGNATVTITGTHSAGRIYFSTGTDGNKNWPIVDSDGDPIKMGQILGYNEDGTTVNIDETVTYVPASLTYSVDESVDENENGEIDEEEVKIVKYKYVLPEAGRLNGAYCFDTPAVIGGMDASFEKRDIDDTYKGIRFKATFYTTSTCTGGGTQSANFGIYLLTKETYTLLGSANVTKAQLDAAGSTVVQVKATKYVNNTSNYVVNAVVFNLNTEARQATELVAIPYAGNDLGTAAITSYNAVFN